MIQDRTIVCVASNWEAHPTSKHHLMRLLAEQNHVVWVNYHASRRPRLCVSDARVALRRLWQARRPLRRVAPGIDLLTPLLLPFPRSRLARRLNAAELVRRIRAVAGSSAVSDPGAARERRASGTDFGRHAPPPDGRDRPRPLQLWLFTPDVPEIIAPLNAECVVYYCVDEFSAFTGFDARLMRELERRTLRAADVVVATSAALRRRLARVRPDVHFVPHGVDFDHFAACERVAPQDVPPDIRTVRRPIFGYIGTLADYVDLEALASAARRRRDWSFVLIGDVRCDTGALRGLSNVHLLGGRPYESLPGYCSRFDVGLIPFRLNRLTRAVNPVKLREYLAAGIPVVAAPLPEVMRFADVVSPAGPEGDLLPACAEALERAARLGRAAIRAYVSDERWEVRVEQVSRLVRERPAPAAGGADAAPPGRPDRFSARRAPVGCCDRV